MKCATRFLTIVMTALFSVLVQACFAQPPAMEIVSPVVNPDRSVTFRLLAPNAKAVYVVGDFAAQAIPMAKDENGVWSTATEPLEPDVYGYNFTMDGLTLPDPNNTFVKTGVIWFGSQVNVPGEKPIFSTVRNVPHGSVHGHWYYSKKLDSVRRVMIYTPPDYDPSSSKKYPVLFLLHGYGDDEGTWTQVGRANFIMDNLLAGGKAKAAIIVMPFGHPTRSVPPLSRVFQKNPVSGDAKQRGEPLFAVEVLENDILENVMPLLEKEYRVSKDRNHRAIAGLSMGGYQALSIGLNNLQHFAYIGAFSSALVGDNVESDFQSFLSDPEKANNDIKLLWMGCGTKDGLLAGNQNFQNLLTGKKIKFESVATPEYGHSWTLWRMYLNELLPKLFQDN